MNLEEMIQHLEATEVILTYLARLANEDSEQGQKYTLANGVVGDAIADLEFLINDLNLLKTEQAEQPAPTEPKDKGFTLPPYSFPPMDTKTITDPLKPPYIATGLPLTVRYTESQIEDQEARY